MSVDPLSDSAPTAHIDQFSRGRYSHRPGLWRLIPHRHYFTMTVNSFETVDGRSVHHHGYQCLRCWEAP